MQKKRALSGFGGRESHLFEIVIDGQEVGSIVLIENGKKLSIKNVKIKENLQSNGFGKMVYRALAKKATLILFPAINSDGLPVPFEGRTIKNPVIFKVSKDIYKSGTMEAVALGTKFNTNEDEPGRLAGIMP